MRTLRIYKRYCNVMPNSLRWRSEEVVTFPPREKSRNQESHRRLEHCTVPLRGYLLHSIPIESTLRHENKEIVCVRCTCWTCRRGYESFLHWTFYSAFKLHVVPHCSQSIGMSQRKSKETVRVRFFCGKGYASFFLRVHYKLGSTFI